MASRCSKASSTLLPFLYPGLARQRAASVASTALRRCYSTPTTINDLPESRLNPAPDDYASPSFADKAQLNIYAGRGGNGCISFLREAYLEEGPPNGGDGGVGGNIYIQAAHGETSLHKLARKRVARAGRGKNGQGSAKSGTRGDDVIITVPVGTIVREIERDDPVADETMDMRIWKAQQKQLRREKRLADMERARLRAEGVEDENPEMEEPEEEDDDEENEDPERRKWLLYPGLSKSDAKQTVFPRLPKRHRFLKQPPPVIHLDLSRPTPHPILLATGGIGGLGNPHFTSREHPRPMFATKGEGAVSMKIELELKLLADVGLVGLPNAGKSTLLRAITNSRTRVGNWAFTTLQPNIGTVVLDKYSGRPTITSYRRYPAQLGLPEAVETEPRTRFTIADIPGLIEGAHLDRGLGIAFLRHVERAGVLAFVIDLSAGDAVKALDALWREVGLYAKMRDEEEQDRGFDNQITWDTASDPEGPAIMAEDLAAYSPSAGPPPGQQIAGKPWFVVATKADLPETKENFAQLKKYLDSINKGESPHPSGVEDAWTKDCTAIPISAINGQGVDRIVHWTVGLLDQ